MAIVKSYQRKTDTTYVYESEAYWDPEKKQSRSKRKLIGKIDKETGDIIPTGKRGRPKNAEEQAEPGAEAPQMMEPGTEAIQKLEGMIEAQKHEILSLRTELDGLKKENRQLLKSRREEAEKNRQLGEIIRELGTLAEKAISAGLVDDP